MKIFIFSIKKVIILLLAIFIFLFSVFLLSQYWHSTLSCSSKISNDYLNNITNLVNGKEKVAYLTFDDGPTVAVTPKILEILEEEDIKATFFVLGKSVEAHPEIVKQAYEQGHYIANHGYSHNNKLLYKDAESFSNEVKNTDLAIGKAIGKENYCSHVFRFPNGFMSSIYKKEKEAMLPLLYGMDYSYLDWNCLTKDSERKYSNSELLNNLIQSSKNKDTLVVLMHDTKDVNDSSLVVKDCINYLKSIGYTFKNLYELI